MISPLRSLPDTAALLIILTRFIFLNLKDTRTLILFKNWALLLIKVIIAAGAVVAGGGAANIAQLRFRSERLTRSISCRNIIFPPGEKV